MPRAGCTLRSRCSEMCLGIPGQVVRTVDGTAGQVALVDVEGSQRKVNVGMLDHQGLDPGDWVLIHLGFAVERMDPDEAFEARAGLEHLGRGAAEANIAAPARTPRT